MEERNNEIFLNMGLRQFDLSYITDGKRICEVGSNYHVMFKEYSDLELFAQFGNMDLFNVNIDPPYTSKRSCNGIEW